MNLFCMAANHKEGGAETDRQTDAAASRIFSVEHTYAYTDTHTRI